MSLDRCIPDLGHNGQLSPEQAARALALYDDQVTELAKSMAPDAAKALASVRTADAVDFEAAQKRMRTLRQVAAQDFAEDWLTRGGERWGRGRKGDDGGGGDGSVPGAGPVGPANPLAARTLIRLVEARRKAIEGQAFAKVREILANHRATLTGKLRRPADMDEIGRAAFGEAVDSLSARELAGTVDEVQDWLRLRANAAGASIGKLVNRGFGQHQDSRKVAEAGFDAWYAAERPRWDLDRMVDDATGQPFTETRLRAVMEGVQKTIASDGALDRVPGGVGKLSFASQLGQHRFIHYKNYDAWKASQEQFGAGTAFDALMGEIKGMSRATAAMEILGPNPEATVRYITDRVKGDRSLFEPGQLKRRDNVKAETRRVHDLWDEYSGALSQPENRRMAVAFAGYRAIAAAAKLLSAAPKAIADIGWGMGTRAMSGLPITSIFGDYLKLLNPFDASDRLLAARLSFVPETWTGQVSGTMRFLGEEMTGEIPRRIADGFLRASGLNAITDAGRGSQGLVSFVYLTTVRDSKWDALEPAWRAALQRYRIGPGEWDAIRAAPISKDIDLVEPHNIAAGEARDRFLEMAHSEQDFAVPVPDLDTRAYLNSRFRKGDLLHEIFRSSPLMFKTYFIATMIRHGGRMAEQPGIGGKLGYLLPMVVSVTAISVLASALLDLANGRSPRPMDDPEVWGDALANGGGLSIVGNIAGIAAGDRYMAAERFAFGPLLTDGFEALSATKGLATGDDKAPWKLARVAGRNVPGQNLWYTRLLTDRLIADQARMLIDPNYAAGFRSIERRAAEKQQEFFWAPGELSPDRAPDFANAIDFEGDK